MLSLVFISNATDNTHLQIQYNGLLTNQLIVAVFSATSTSGDTSTPPSTVTDSLANTLTLLKYVAENTGASQPAYAVYAGFVTVPGTSTISVPSQFQPADVTYATAVGQVFSTPYRAIALDQENLSQMTHNPADAANTVRGSVSTTQTGSDDLVLSTVFYTPNTVRTFLTPGFPANATALGSVVENSNTSIFSMYAFESTTNESVTFGALTGSNSGNGAGYVAQFALSFSALAISGAAVAPVFIHRAPRPVVQQEGRAIATMIVDCTQYQYGSLLNGLNLQELKIDGAAIPIVTGGWESYMSFEVDLEHLTQGSGLSEIRCLMAQSRPLYQVDTHGVNSDFVQSAGFQFGLSVAFITNMTTQQTIVLGGSAMQWYESLNNTDTPTETLQVAFPATRGAMKLRFLALSNITVGVGKYTLHFTNYDLPGSFISTGQWLGKG